jgi:DNA-binding transcriptional ArsR family regulator
LELETTCRFDLDFRHKNKFCVTILSLNAVAEKFDMSRPAISRHIRILTECGLIHIQEKGRERICQARLKKLSEVSAFADQYKVFWQTKLEDLDQFLKNKKKKK